MDPIFTVIVIILSVLAVLDLIVGVSNDAINFLNSSLGSKVASFRVIMIVASIGILVGVITSSGMMEVARKGVFHPEMFTFTEVMMLFVGMMMADVVLLNTFNLLGLPTSTTVSLIFELLGSAVAVTVYKVATDASLTLADVGSFINTGKALGMISAILVSVALSFLAGSIGMYFSRMLFTFRFKDTLKRYGALWCGISIVGILYFAIFKGMKSSGLITPEINEYLSHNMLYILLGVWVVVALILKGLQMLKVDILKITILSGTFSLALAFVGNDLVNFIGVPLAGIDSYKIALDSGDMNMLMSGLADNSKADTWMLVLSGIIMVITLFCSKTAMKVAATELNLSSQNEEDERFGSTPLARGLVRAAINLNKAYKAILPDSVLRWIDKRFTPLTAAERTDANYDKIRAVVNLATASILICVGTSFKLPLSTTYVVFMVAMGSSLADRAWGRDSAVYRVSGVTVVISGWFLTALAGFVLAFIVGTALMWGHWYALIGMIILCGYALCYNLINKSKKKVEEHKNNSIVGSAEDASDVLYTCTEKVCETMKEVSVLYNRMLVALYTENRKALKEAVVQSETMYHEANDRKYGVMPILRKLENQNIDTAHYYVQIVDYMCEVTKALLHCTRPAYEHINNNHRGMTEEQIVDLKLVNDGVDEIFHCINTMLSNKDFSKLDDVMEMRDKLFVVIATSIKNQIKRLKTEDMSTRTSALYLNILNETKTMVLQSRNLLKSQAYFLNAINSEKHEEEVVAETLR